MSREVLSDDPPVVVSVNAGDFYCAHALWLGQRVGLSLDEQGRPRAGFLHVPGVGDRPEAAPAERHAATARVLERMLRGLAAEAAGTTALVTGFGRFGGIDDNPTGAFLESGELKRVAARVPGVQVVSAVLPVDDRAFDPGLPTSVPRIIGASGARAWIALGVARGDDVHRIEVLPTDAGLADGDVLVHERGRPARRSGPANRWLAECYRHGAA